MPYGKHVGEYVKIKSKKGFKHEGTIVGVESKVRVLVLHIPNTGAHYVILTDDIVESDIPVEMI